MDTYVIALWVLLGFALSTWFMMHLWLPDPPPDILGKYITILVAGAVGGVIGGFLAHGRASSDPMPGIIGAAAGRSVPLWCGWVFEWRGSKNGALRRHTN